MFNAYPPLLEIPVLVATPEAGDSMEVCVDDVQEGVVSRPRSLSNPV